VTTASVFLIPNAMFFAEMFLLMGVPAISVWAFVGAASTPEEAFRSVGRSKTAWVVGIAVGTLFLGPVGTALAIYYLVGVRPKIHALHAEVALWS
jgi:hypothetical protein